MKRPFPLYIIGILLFSHIQVNFAQTYTMGPEEYISWEEFITDYFDEIEQESLPENDEHWQTETLELLEELHHHPININTAQKEDLLVIPFLKEAQIDSILSYRQSKHLFRSLGELQWINDIPYATRCRLSLFAFAGDTIQTPESFSSRFFKGKHSITSRLDLPLYKRAGDQQFTQAELDKYPNRYYLGNKFGNTTRYRYQWKKDVAYGITLQKDNGEPFAAHNNYPFDYNSFYFYYRPSSQHYAIWIGDYNINIGEGLLIGNSFYYGPLQMTENTLFKQSRVRPHTSSDEINFYRGAAAQFRLRKNWNLMAFASYRKLDGNIKNDTLVSFKTDGMHRSLTELDNRRTIGNAVMGGRLSWDKPHGHIAANTYWSHYSKTIYPPLRNYNHHYLRGTSAAGLSVDYFWKSRHWQFTGETATDKKFHLATTNSMRFSLNSNNSFLFQQRCLSSRFVAPFGNTLQNNSHVQNEYGFVLGMTLQPFDRIHLTSYVDYSYHPQPIYRANQASKRLEYFIQSKYAANQHLYFTFRYKLKTKQQNITGHDDIMQFVTDHHGRLTANYTTRNYSLNIAADIAIAAQQTSNNTYGWMLSTRNHFKLSRLIDIHTFGAVFFTDDYASRLYAYEPQLQYAASFPVFAYHGIRFAGVAKWNICKSLYTALRYGWTKYFNRDQISSGTQLIRASSKNDLSIQLGYLF